MEARSVNKKIPELDFTSITKKSFIWKRWRGITFTSGFKLGLTSEVEGLAVLKTTQFTIVISFISNLADKSCAMLRGVLYLIDTGLTAKERVTYLLKTDSII
ncbi:hypothetical protein MKW98_014059 [Papaver atlanticum]|uniref:Uncharacterized protein n=1 Tax=Papaver atlanticum TaxID=357466 RepID=A0AAD4XG55_9MAGN|nr:hypothetical protein MKW98_014059 [Papaver atlanticum]